jgi:hypothetical protein
LNCIEFQFEATEIVIAEGILVADPRCSDVVAAGLAMMFRRAVFGERFSTAQSGLCMGGQKGVDRLLLCIFRIIVASYFVHERNGNDSEDYGDGRGVACDCMDDVEEGEGADVWKGGCDAMRCDTMEMRSRRIR